MPAAIYNPVIDKGADYSFALIFSDSSNAPIALSSATITAPIFNKEGDIDPISNFAVSKDPNTTGRAIFTLSAAVSAEIVPSKPYYEIWVQSANNGPLKRYTRGILNLDK